MSKAQLFWSVNFRLLPEDLQRVIRQFAAPVQAAIDRFKHGGPLTYQQNRILGFPRGQSPSVLGINGLKSQPYWELPDVSQLLKSNVAAISTEFARCTDVDPLLSAKRDSGKQWNAYYLMEEGVWNYSNLSKCPTVQRVLDQLAVCESCMGYVYFSELSPGTIIDPHFGCSNCKLRIQLPLIPNDHHSSDDMHATILVNGQKKSYRCGEAIIFDDSYIHSVKCEKRSCTRVVLLIDIWHPELCERDINLLRLSPSIDINGMTLPPCSHASRRNHNSYSSYSGNSGGWHNVDLHQQLPVLDHHLLVDSRYPRTVYSQDDAPSAGYGKPFDYLAKIVLWGDYGIGKTSFLLRFCERSFSSQHICTIGVDFKICQKNRLGKAVKLQVWDSTGPERFRQISTAYLRGAHCLLLMFDTTDIGSFNRLDNSMERIRAVQKEDLMIMMVGTKADLVEQRQVGRNAALSKAEAYGIRYFETSSKSGYGVDNVIDTFVSVWLNERIESGALTRAEEHRKKLEDVKKKNSENEKHTKCVLS